MSYRCRRRHVLVGAFSDAVCYLGRWTPAPDAPGAPRCAMPGCRWRETLSEEVRAEVARGGATVTFWCQGEGVSNCA